MSRSLSPATFISLLPLSSALSALGLAFFLTTELEATHSTRPEFAPAPEHKPYEQAIPGSAVKFKMMAIPEGTFTIGSSNDEKGRKADEGPAHRVQVGAFWMGEKEVTWEEYDLYFKSKDQPPPWKHEDPRRKADAITRPTGPYIEETFGYGRNGQPVISISHHSAMEYCRWLTRKTGVSYRLPTEAEWEYACRAGTKTAYSFGDDASKLTEYGWFVGNSDDAPHPVGKKKPNPWGLYDMHGNVMEWCLDHYFADTYAKRSAQNLLSVNPVLVPTEHRFSHVTRGGSWLDKPQALRSACRRGSDKTWLQMDPLVPQSIWWLTSADFVGFRIVRAVNEPLELIDLRSKIVRDSPN